MSDVMLAASPTELAARSTQARQATKRLRAELAAGTLTIADVMRDRPDGLADRTLFEIVLMARGVRRARLRELNARALDDGVNLAVTLRHADAYTRNWIAANALRRSPLGAWQQLML